MKSFLSTVAEYVNDSDLAPEKHLLVFPSLRSLSVFESHFISSKNSASWLPKTVSYSDFISRMSEYRRLSSSELYLELVDSLNNHFKDKNVLQGVSSWGPVLLKDFEEIINQRVEREPFFENFRNLKAIEQWNPEELPDSIAAKYIGFWERAKEMFEVFLKHCEKRKVGSNALLLHNAIINLQNSGSVNLLQKMGFSHPESIHFVGFTALTVQEEVLLEQLRPSFKFLFWMDSIHKSLSGNPASFFIKKNRSLFRNNFKSADSNQSLPRVKRFACPGNIEQVQLLFELLNNMKGKELSNTVVFLPDASLISTILNHQSNSNIPFNTGIGFSLKHFDSFKFTLDLLDLFGKNNFQIEVLDHPFVLDLIESEVTREIDFENNSIIDQIKQRVLLIEKASRERNSIIFLDVVRLLLNSILNVNYLKKNKLERSSLSLIVEEMSHILGLFQKKRSIENLIFPVSMLKDALKNLELTIKGEKGSGVQILSTLEGRGLDFKNVIYLSFNEDNFLVSNTGFIPGELRRNYNLPSLEDKNAVMSYHIYRSISRADNLFLIYNSHSEGTSSGEGARFMAQLDFLYSESPSDLSTYASTPAVKIENENRIEKSVEVVRKIEKHLKNKGLSPSALNTYLENPHDFYLRYVLGLKEPEQKEILHPSIIGTVVHNCLEATYNDFVLKGEISVINKAIKELDTACENELRKVLKFPVQKQGELQLLLSVLSNWLMKFYRFDMDRIKENIKIVSLEEEISLTVPKSHSLLRIPFKLTGFIDRVEKEDEITRIIDYKTGKVVSRDLRLKKADIQSFVSEKSKALQLLMYTYIYKGIHPSKNFEAGIYSFRNSDEGIIPLQVDSNSKIDLGVIEEFEKGLFSVVEEMLDPTIPFIRVEPKYENLLPF